MADVFSVVSSSIGVLSLCLQATQTTFNLVEGMKYPEKIHKDLLQVLIDLRVVLRTAETIFLTEQPQPSTASLQLLKELHNLSEQLVTLLPKLRKDRASSRFRLLLESRSLEAHTKRLRQGVDLLRISIRTVSPLGQVPDLTQTLQHQKNDLSSLLSLQQGRLFRSRTRSRLEPERSQSSTSQGLIAIENSNETLINQLSQIDHESKHLFHVGMTPKGSGMWILSDPEYVRWLNSTRAIGLRNWLWLSGLPGSGKTTLTSVVIDELFSQSQKDTNMAVAFFYFDYTASITIQEVALNLIKQLSSCLPPSIDLPDEVIKVHRLVRLGRTPTLGSLVDTLSRVCAKFQRPILVFDGLDEFTGTGLLNFLHMLKDAPCKVFAASRDVPSFEELFSGSPHVVTHVHPSDITSYTSQMIESSPDIKELLDNKLLEEINQTFVKNSGVTFLLPVLQMQHLLEQTSTWEIRQCLIDIPKDLEALYHRTVSRVLLQSEARSRLARKVLIWVSYAKRSLTILELQHALAVSSDEPTINIEKFPPPSIIKAACFNLISIDPGNSGVLLSHFSFQNYLETHRDELFKDSKDFDVIPRACLDYLHLAEFHSGPCASAKDLEERLRNYPLARYAALYWGANQQNSVSLEVERRITELLRSPLNLMAVSQIYLAEAQLLLFDAESLETFSPLHWAALFGLVEELKRMISTDKRKVNSKDPFNRTPLHWAVERRQKAVIESLLGNGADRSALDRNGANVLHLAAKDSLEICSPKLLSNISNADLLQKDNSDQTPLQVASIHGSLEIVRQLLQSMRGLDATHEITKVALEGAVSNGRADVVGLLLRTIDLDPKELRTAARYGFKDVARTLFAYGADINAQDSNGVTAVHEASEAGKIDMIHFLLDNGADINAKDKNGNTPLHCAVKQSNRLVVELLLRAGADPNSSQAGTTAFDLAVVGNDTEMVLLLQSYGAQISRKSNLPTDPLSTAIQNGNESMVRLLLDADPPRFFDSDKKNTLLHNAAASGHTRIVQLLLEAGANVNARDPEGHTPLSIAMSSKNRETEVLLLDNGANPELQERKESVYQNKGRFQGSGELRRVATWKADIGTPGDTRNLCVGIHFETHFLQACFGFRENLDDMKMVEWLDPQDDHSKPTYVPTRIAYPEENKGHIQSLQWGYNVTPTLTSYSSSRSFIDPEERDRIERDRSTRASSRAPTELCADFLHQARQYIRAYLADHVPPHVLDQPITYCFTISALWPSRLLNELRSVIKRAGFGNDRVMFVAESEAAALVVLAQLDAENVEPIKDGECFTICQCGDVTVDLVTYTLQKRKPRLIFSEACAGTGGLCGFGTVQKEFEKWMKMKFGDAYESLPPALRGPGSKFAAEFEALKHEVERNGPSKYLLHLPMNCSDCEYFVKDGEFVQLDRSDLERFYETSVEEIIQLIEGQLHDTALRSQRRPQNIFLTGSFASCKYLYERVKERFQGQGISVLLPPKSTEAAVLGAALHAVSAETDQTKIIAGRIARCHYGISIKAPFNEGSDDMAKRFWDETTGQFVTEKMQWFIKRGDKLPASNTTRINTHISWDTDGGSSAHGQLEIFSSTSDSAPVYRADPMVSQVTMVDYVIPNALQRASTIVTSSGKRSVDIPLALNILIRIGESTLEVKVACPDGKGLTTIGRASTSLSF